MPSWRWPLSKVIVTSASPTLRRDEEPLKMTSAISPPRRLLALCSPMIQRTASTILLLPEPLGPTMPVMPSPKSKVVLSAKLLKPTSSSRLSMSVPASKSCPTSITTAAGASAAAGTSCYYPQPLLEMHEHPAIFSQPPDAHAHRVRLQA